MSERFEDIQSKLCSCFLSQVLKYQPPTTYRLERIKDKVLKDFLFLDDEDVALLASKKFRTIKHLENLGLHELDLMRDAKEIEPSTYLSLRFYVMWNSVHHPHYTDIESMTQDDFFDLDRKSIEDAFLQMKIPDTIEQFNNSKGHNTIDTSIISWENGENDSLLLNEVCNDRTEDPSTVSTAPYVDLEADNDDTKQTVAKMNVDWDVAGKEVGLKIWRIENENKFESRMPKLGIIPWSRKRYGQFFTGDSYIVLSTTQGDDKDGALLFDIFFWTGSQSTYDDIGVVAYKTCELDNLLNVPAIQHREVQYHESSQFLALFKGCVDYLDRGISGGLRGIADTEDDKTSPPKLFHIRRTNRHTRCVQVPAKCESLNQGDTFVLDAGEVIYTWFGTQASGFAKRKAGALSHNLIRGVGRKVTRQESDVEDDNEEFWNLLGGKGEIMEANDARVIDVPKIKAEKPTMFILSDDDNELNIETVPVDKESLVSNNVCLVDIGTTVFMWVGKKSTKGEHTMRMARTYLRNTKKSPTTNIIRILEGQEYRAPDWPLQSF